MSNSDRSAASSSPMTQQPSCFARSRAAGRPPTTAIGRCSMAPAAALATVGVTWTARCRGNTMPVAPAPSAERSSAPRLPGSVTPSTATRNGGGPGPAGGHRSSRSVSSQRRRLGQHALGRLAAGLGLELRGGSPRCIGTRRSPARATMSATMPASGGRWPPTARGPCAGRPAAARVPPGAPRPARRRGPRSRSDRLALEAVRPVTLRRRAGGRQAATGGRCTAPGRPPRRRLGPAADARFALGALRRPRRAAAPVLRHVLADQGDGPAGDALAAAEGAEALGPPALDLTGAPAASASRASISPRRGASFGRSHTTLQSTLAGVQPAPRHHGRDLDAACRSSRRRPTAGRCRGSAGRCRRGRRRRAGRRRRRGRSTSASLWPARPALTGELAAAEHEPA